MTAGLLNYTKLIRFGRARRGFASVNFFVVITANRNRGCSVMKVCYLRRIFKIRLPLDREISYEQRVPV